jgi:hypothetical protein
MKRLPVLEAPGALGVCQEGLSYVGEGDLLPLTKRLDRGVLALSFPSPSPQEEGERGEVGVQR